MSSAKVITMSPPDGFLEDLELLFDEFVAPIQKDEPEATPKTPNTHDTLADALSQFGETDPKSYARFNPEPPQEKSREEPEFTPVERMLLEEKLLGHRSPEVRKGAADDLVDLAENEKTKLPSVCRIRDMLTFWNQKSGGEEFAPQLRLVKKALSLKAKETEELRSFETRKKPSYVRPMPQNQPRHAVIITKPKHV